MIYGRLRPSYGHRNVGPGIGSLGSSSMVFDFSYNQIDFIPPEIGSRVGVFRQLSLKYNKLIYLPKEFFGFQNYHYVVLDLSENPFSIAELNLIKQKIKNTSPNIQVFY
jgi:hypothetical protein